MWLFLRFLWNWWMPLSSTINIDNLIACDSANASVNKVSLHENRKLF